MMKPITILIICAVVTSIGQLSIKKGLLDAGPAGIRLENIGILFNPYILLGIIFALSGWVLYLVALSKSELSYAYPIWSLSYVLVPVVSLIIFREQISFMKAGGLTFLTLGIILIALSQ